MAEQAAPPAFPGLPGRGAQRRNEFGEAICQQHDVACTFNFAVPTRARLVIAVPQIKFPAIRAGEADADSSTECIMHNPEQLARDALLADLVVLAVFQQLRQAADPADCYSGVIGTGEEPVVFDV